jgi:hypothetical protein
MKGKVLPIPVEADLNVLVRQGAKATGLKLSDVMRQGLRHGVPAFLQRLQAVSARRVPKCLAYLDDYPASLAPARGLKARLRAKLSKKHGRSDC